MSLEEVESVVETVENLMGEELTPQQVKDLEDYLMLLLSKQNALVEKIKKKLVGEPSQQSEGDWWEDLFIYYSEGMIVSFNDIESWKSWAEENELVENEDYEIIPPDLIVRSDPNSKGVMVTDGPLEFYADWDNIEEFSIPPTTFNFDYVALEDDDIFKDIPFVLLDSLEGLQAPPQDWLNSTCCLRSTWFQDGQLIKPTNELRYRNRYSTTNKREGQPSPIGFRMTNEPTELAIFKNDSTYTLLNSSITVKFQKNWDYKDSINWGVDKPVPTQLVGGRTRVALIKILKNVKLRPKGFVEPGGEPARKSS